MASCLASCSLRVRSLLTTLVRSTSVGEEEGREEAAAGGRREVEERSGGGSSARVRRGEARDQVSRQAAKWEMLYTWPMCSTEYKLLLAWQSRSTCSPLSAPPPPPSSSTSPGDSTVLSSSLKTSESAGEVRAVQRPCWREEPRRKWREVRRRRGRERRKVRWQAVASREAPVPLLQQSSP